MELFRRPLASFCICFTLFSVAGYFLWDNSLIIAIVLAFLCAILIILGAALFRKYFRVALFFAVCFAASSLALFVSYSHFVDKTALAERFYGDEVEISACVKSVAYKRSYGACYDIVTREINGESVEIKMSLEAETASLEKDDIFRMKVAVSPFDENIGDESYKVSAMAGGEVCACTQTSPDVLIEGRNNTGVIGFIFDLSDKVSERFNETLSDRGAGLYRAVFAGDDDGIDGADKLSVRRSGVSHLLAVSGMHFSTIMAILLLLLKGTGMSVGKRSVLLLAIALLYMAFTGFSPSVVRSGIMLGITYFGALVGRQKDSFTALFVAMSLMIATTPYIILDASFWLSSSATLGIILWSPIADEYFSKKHRAPLTDILRGDGTPLLYRIFQFASTALERAVCALPTALLTSVLVSAFALAFSLPFSVLFFDCMSLCSLPCGLILSPLITAVIATSPVVIALGDFGFVSDVCSAFGDAFFEVTHFFSECGDVYLFVDYAPTRIAIAVFTVAVVLICFVVKKNKPLVFLCVALIIAVPVSSRICESTVYSVGDYAYGSTKNSDALCIRTEEGAVIADMGSDSRASVRSAVATSSELHLNRVRAYVFTTVDARCVHTLRYLLSLTSIKTVYFPEYATDKGKVAVDYAAEYAEDEGLEVRYFRYGEKFYVSGCSMLVSELEYLERSDVEIYSVSAQCGDESVLWTCESYFEGEKFKNSGKKDHGTVILGRYGPKISEDRLPDISHISYERALYPVEDGEYYGKRLERGGVCVGVSTGEIKLYLRKDS